MNDLSELVNGCGPLAPGQSPKYDLLDRARKLGALGFVRVAGDLTHKVLLAEKLECIVREKYPVITPAKIKGFLERKAMAYNEDLVRRFGTRKNTYASHVDHLLSNSMERMMRYMDDKIFDNVSTTPWQTLSRPIEFTAIAREVDLPEPTPADFTVMTRDFLSPSKDRIAGFSWTEVRVADYPAIPPDNALAALKVAQAKEIFHYFTIASVNAVKDPLLLGRLEGSEDRFYLAAWGEDVALDDVI